MVTCQCLIYVTLVGFFLHLLIVLHTSSVNVLYKAINTVDFDEFCTVK